jgi:hypothetical protein
MGEENYLNLEYILLKVYRLFTGIDAGEVPAQTLLLIERIAWVGIGFAFMFLILVVFLRMRLGQIEHEGWSRRLEEEVALAQKRNVRAPLNPRWQHVIQLANARAPAGESDWRRAIIEADTMLADMLTEHGFQGENVGEQLRGANPLHFTTLDFAWEAHKLRNTIAHMGEGYELTERETHATIDLYRRVFEEFNYI